MLQIFANNLISPAILFFVLGVVARYLKSDLNVPDTMGRYLSFYLMMSIGFRGGASVAEIECFTEPILYSIIAAIILSFSIPFIAYFFLSRTTNLDKPTAAALASLYGSVSIVTFASCINFLQLSNISYSGYMVSILALMEAPAILSGLYLAHRMAPETNNHAKEEKILAKEIFANGSVLLMVGSFLVGAISGNHGLEKVSGFLVNPFQGILCMFMLDMGLMVMHNIKELRSISTPTILFGLYMPFIGALLGKASSMLIGLSIGDSALLITLCASSSYIAAPAAMRLALPEAKSSIYIPVSLGLTFPTNIILGIPLYTTLAGL